METYITLADKRHVSIAKNTLLSREVENFHFDTAEEAKSFIDKLVGEAILESDKDVINLGDGEYLIR